MKTKLWAISLMALTTLLTSSAQIFYKMAAKDLEFNLFSLLSNYNLIIGMVLYMVGAVLMITALKGGELSVLYPIVATSYIWVGIASSFFFHESLNLMRWLGIATIFFGVIFIGIGSRDKEIIKEAGAAL